jgi:hypothetical protein
MGRFAKTFMSFLHNHFNCIKLSLNNFRDDSIWLNFIRNPIDKYNFFWQFLWMNRKNIGDSKLNEPKKNLIVQRTNIRKFMLKQNMFLTKWDLMVYTNFGFWFQTTYIFIFLMQNDVKVWKLITWFSFHLNTYFLIRNIIMNFGQTLSI